MTRPESAIPHVTPSGRRFNKDHPRYKWIVLTNTTLGMLIATVNASIVLISLPAIFRGIDLDPLEPSNVSYLLWMLMGYLLVTAVLVVSLGRLGDMYGRVKIYNAGFAVFAAASVLLALDPFTGSQGALWLIGWRVVQGVGGAMLMANSTAILTDAFPADRRGMALGINQVSALAGSFVGLVLGGALAEWHWRAVFWVSVPIGIVGTVWGYHSLHELGRRVSSKVDWLGNITFGLGLTVMLAGITYGIQPYGDDNTGWKNPWVLAALIGGVALLGLFVLIEATVAEPMFHLSLFQDPSVLERQHRAAARRDRSRRPAVHADHLAAGDLAAAAWVRLRGHPALGRHLHAAAHGRLPDRRARCPATSPTGTARGCSPPSA